MEGNDPETVVSNYFFQKDVKDLTDEILHFMDQFKRMGISSKDSILVLCKLGHLARRNRRVKHAVEFYNHSVAYCKQFDESKDLLVKCVLNISKIDFMRGISPKKTLELQMETLSLVNENNLTAEDALLMLYAGIAQHFMGEEMEGFYLRQRGDVALKNFCNEAVYNEAMPLIGWHIYLQGNFKSTIAYYENMIIAIENREDIEIIVFAYPPIIYSYMFLGEFNRALVLNEIIYKHALECRDFPAMILMRSLWGRILVCSDDKERGEEVLYKAYAESLQENYYWGSYYSLLSLCQLHLNSGNIIACKEALLLARAVAKEHNIGRMYSSPFMLDALKVFEAQGLGCIENMCYEDELQRHIASENIHLKGVCYRHLAMIEKSSKGNLGSTLEMLRKSVDLLKQSGNFIELGKSYIELARIMSERDEKSEAKKYATLGWRVLGAYADYFPTELLDLVEEERINLDIEVALNTLWLELRHVIIPDRLVTKLMTQFSRLLKVECSAFAVFYNNKPEVKASQNIFIERRNDPQYQRMMGMVCHTAAIGKTISIFNEKIVGSKTFVKLDSEPRFVFCAPFFYQEKVRAVLYLESYYRSSDLSSAEFKGVEKFIKNIGPHLFATLFYGQQQNVEQAGNSSRKSETSPIAGQKDYCESTSEAVQVIMDRISIVAKTAVPVLFTGETGVGKEVFAKELYHLSDSKDVFIKINCGAIPETLIESELFGYERGSFTGANQMKKGYFEMANGGTIFLDEIGELSLLAQVKLLRVLQEHEIMRIGGTEAIKVKFRLIAATNKNLKVEVDKGAFRSDLYYRLNVMQIEIPPLRKRKSDIPKFASYFIEQYCKELGKEICHIAPGSLMQLLNYEWPGNVRELENMVQKAVLLSQGSEIVISELELHNTEPSMHKSSIQTLEEVEHNYILKILKHCNGKIAGPNGAAELLGLKRTTLISRMNKFGIQISKNE
ncbi:MAG: sigma-54 interaction domain-containing protein [Negativicutes bacterium]